MTSFAPTGAQPRRLSKIEATGVVVILWALVAYVALRYFGSSRVVVGTVGISILMSIGLADAAARWLAFRGIANRLPRGRHPLHRLPVGRTASGRRWRLSLREQSVLIGGIPGSGKSGAIGAILGLLVRRDDVRVFGLDLKSGTELGPWSPWLDELARDVEGSEALLSKLNSIIDERNSSLYESGRRTYWKHLSARRPACVLVLDEAAELFAASKAAGALMERILRLGRSAGVSVVLATQKPTIDAIPSAIRDLCGVRIALRTTTAEQTKATLGILPTEGQPLPTTITKRQRGRAVVNESGDLCLIQFCWMSDKSVRSAVQKAI